MLNLEYLMEEAKSNGLPILKKRAVIREYLQVLILGSIYRHEFGRSMYFTGGTALRFFHALPRFSEDLDFDTANLSFEKFNNIIDYMKKELLKEGFDLTASTERRKNLYICEVYFKDLMKTYGIIDRRGFDLMIKLEVYKPRWSIKSESDILSLYGYNFSSLLLDKASLFSEKLCALFNRKRGRDIYDTLFLLKKKFTFNQSILNANNYRGLPEKLILEHLKKLTQKELKSLAEQVRPFLFKEDDIELILKAPLYAEKFLKEYNK